MILASGVAFLAGEPGAERVLLLRRTDGGGWSTPGGRIEDGESPLEAAEREATEELGALPQYRIDPEPFARTQRDGVDYRTYAARVSEEFTPTLNDEHDAFRWVSVGPAVAELEDTGAIADAEWKESDHPRAPDGKFGSGGASERAVRRWKAAKYKNSFWLSKALVEEGATPEEFAETMKRELDLKDGDEKLDPKTFEKIHAKVGASPKELPTIEDLDKREVEKKQRPTVKNNVEISPVPGKYREMNSLSGRERETAVAEYGDEAFNALPEDQRAAVEYYSEGGAVTMNSDLRRKAGPSKALRPSIDAVQSAIVNSVLPVDTEVGRGIGRTFKQITGLDPSEAVGAVFTHKGFFSTSRDLNKAAEFGSGMGVGTESKNPVLMTVKLKAGTRGAMVMPHQIGESEILLPHGSRFEIKSVNVEHGQTFVKLEYLGLDDEPRADSVDDVTLARVDTLPDRAAVAELEDTGAIADAEWKESDHPRAPDGKFGSGNIRSAIEDYTASYDILRIVANNPEKASPRAKKIAMEVERAVVNAINEAPRMKATTLYRGVADPIGSVGSVKTLGKLISTSKDRRIAQNYAGSDGHVIEVEVPEGARGLDVNAYLSGHFSEKLNEVILPPDARFEVVGENRVRLIDDVRTDATLPEGVTLERVDTLPDRAAGRYDPETRTVSVARYLELGDGTRRVLANPERLLAHELGHARDHALNWVSNDDAFKALLAAAWERLDALERLGAAYYLSDPGEAFAEALAFAVGPVEGARYFGTLDPGRVQETLGDVVEWARSKASA